MAAVLFHDEQTPIDVDAIGEDELALLEQLAYEEHERSLPEAPINIAMNATHEAPDTPGAASSSRPTYAAPVL